MIERRSKSIFIRDVMCPTCNIRGSLQVLNPNTFNGRIRHYLKLSEDRKPLFRYCKVSKEFIQQILSKQNDHNTDQNQVNHDRKLSNSGLITENNSRNKFHQRVLAFKA
jgi:hypothetical protein